MKPFLPLQKLNRLRSVIRNRRGIALVIVLAMLVLLSGLLVAFITTATTERNATQASSDSATTRQIADSTVNLVLGQLREATTPPEGSTWASQPGAIRTYSGKISNSRKALTVGSTTGAYYNPYTEGTQDYVFKLYSAEKLKEKSSVYSSADLPNEVSVIEKWDRTDPRPDYVDLNEPYLSVRADVNANATIVEPHYPIIDPRAKYTSQGNENNTAAPGIVDGFDAKIIKDPKLHLLSANNGTGSAVPYIPMPVKWLYVLKDGSIGSASRETLGNPIVGRTAFWTDDESCKLNINTASEGTFWDTPIGSTEQEAGTVENNASTYRTGAKSLGLAASQPVRGEYQRYPGHPATTSLSPVLGWLWGIKPSTDIYPSVKEYVNYKEALYQITPFMPWTPPKYLGKVGKQTSKGATVDADQGTDVTKESILAVANKHLYANPDELIFTPKRIDKGLALPNEITNGKQISPEDIEKVRFFLTATSRAPDINLFGRPRVTLWPIAENFEKRTNFDDLFAFSSTIYKDPNNVDSNDKRFYLTRSDAKSDTVDFGRQNKAMYEYLQFLTSKSYSVPGFGGSFEDKFKGDRDQILTEIFDYGRSTNLVDTGTSRKAANSTKFNPYTPRFYRDGYTEAYGRAARSVDWSGQVTPLKIDNDTMGLGRFITISEAALIFHRPRDPLTTVSATRHAQCLQGILALEMATPMAGFPAIRETYWTKIKANAPMIINLQGGKVARTGIDANICTNWMYNICNLPAHEITQGRGFQPTLGFQSAMHYFLEHPRPSTLEIYAAPDDAVKGDPNRNKRFDVGVKIFSNRSPYSLNYTRQPQNSAIVDANVVNATGAGTVAYYPYVTDFISLEKDNTQFNFGPVTFQVEIYSGEAPDDSRSKLVQVVNLSFPGVTTFLTLPTPTTNPANDVSFAARFDKSTDNSRDVIGVPSPTTTSPAYTARGAVDVVRSIEFTGPFATGGQRGDIRLGAALRIVPPNYFQPRDGATVYNSAALSVHGLTSSHGDKQQGHTSGTSLLAKGGTNGYKVPQIPNGINGVLRADGGPGDWDRGLSKHNDGAMSNKVDEGNIRFDYTDATQAYRVPYFHGRNIEDTGYSFFTPNRQMPSVVMIGSLPAGVKRGRPWETLLFRPDRENGVGHPGAREFPPDHLMLDLFHLPVVEPYAISEPFSTAGKVNMNYVIAPFGYAAGESGSLPGTSNGRSYLRRDSALRGVLKSTFITAVPTSTPEGGHAENALTGSSAGSTFRLPIDLDKTIGEFETRLNDQGTTLTSRQMALFRSASEICEIDLFPKATSITNWNTFWESNAQTGDNLRERPYAHIYPRLTTKSNVFTVHMRCQSIRKAPNSKNGIFDPVRDQVLGEYRGSAVLERYIDPNDEKLRTYSETKERVDEYYRYRIVSTKQFAPH